MLQTTVSGRTHSECQTGTDKGDTGKDARGLDQLPKRLQARAKALLHEILYAPDRKSALEETAMFSEEYAARCPKVVETLTKDRDRVLSVFDCRAEDWLRQRRTNPIESSFAIVKARTKKTNRVGSRKAGVAMAWKFLLAAE